MVLAVAHPWASASSLFLSLCSLSPIFAGPQPVPLRLTHEHDGRLPGLVLQNHEQLAVEEANVEEGGGGVRVGPRRIAPRQARQRERELRQQPRHVDAEQLARLRDRSGK